MARLTSDRKLERYGSPAKATKFTDEAAAGTYYVGTVVMQGGDDGMIKPVSGTVTNGTGSLPVEGTIGVGVVTTHQVISSDGDALDYESGPFTFTSSGFTTKSRNALAYFESDDTVAHSTEGTNRVLCGRFLGFVSGSNSDCIVSIGGVPSGSAV